MNQFADRRSADAAMPEERIARVEKLLRGAAEFTPNRSAPADLVDRAVRRAPARRIGGYCRLWSDCGGHCDNGSAGLAYR